MNENNDPEITDSLLVNGLDAHLGEAINKPISFLSLGREIEKSLSLQLKPTLRMSRIIQVGEHIPFNLDLENKVKSIKDSPGIKELLVPGFSDTIAKEIDFFDQRPKEWGIIFPEGIDPVYIKVFKPLVDHRGGGIYYYKPDTHAFEWETYAVPEGETPPRFLLIVGSTDEVPFFFQNELDISYSVGRVMFSSPQNASRYVNAILAYETETFTKKNRNVCFFSPSFDLPTIQSQKYLSEKIAASLIQVPRFNVKHFKSSEATKVNFLKEVVEKKKDERQDFLMVATHGCASADLAIQEQVQGAWLFQDKELLESKQICPGIYSSFDVEAEAGISQAIIFSFACYTGGTLKNSIYNNCIPQSLLKEGLLKYQSKKDFVGNLPVSLLNAKNPCLGIIAHIDPVWNTFLGKNNYAPYLKMVHEILRGVRVGEALNYLNSRSAVLSVQLTNSINEQLSRGEAIDNKKLADIWLHILDAQYYTFFGDPFISMRPLA